MNIRGIWATRHIYVDGHLLSPTISIKVLELSPRGFNWGDEGPGTGQAALAILLLATNRREALELYEIFREEILEDLPQDDFDMDVDFSEWLEDARALRRRRENREQG